MSTCTAAEIERKRKEALEKLKARKGNVTSTSSTKSNNSNCMSNTKSSPQATSASSFYKNGPSTSTENKASSFLNALKHSSILSNRQNARDAIHPYQRNQKLHSGNTNDPKRSLLSLTPPVANIFTKSVTCTLYMISSSRFEVKPSSFHAQLIEIFKTIPSKIYDAKTRMWNFSVKDYQLVQQKVGCLKPDVVIGTIPKSVINLLLTAPKELDFACLKSIEPLLAEKLMPFQQEGVCFAIAQHGRLMICDEMGLGKTYQALAIADFYKENWPLFICTTASTRESWASHVRTLLPSMPVHYVQVLTNNQQYFGDAKVLITSYNMMERHINSLLERKFGFLIFDESHMLKNHKAKCTTMADRLAMQAKHVILLSGTPALSRPLELFTQLQLIDRKFMNFMEFTSRYCDGKQSQFGWDATGQSNLQELNVVLKFKYMIRRTKADVLPDLAAKFRETVVLDQSLVWPDNDTKATLDKFAKNFIASKGREREEILLNFYAQTASVKTRAVCAYLKTLLKDNIKFIVFAHHRVMMDAITECFTKNKVDFVRIDGSTKNDFRAEYIKHFQTSSSCRAAVLSLKACNSGITLTAAEMIVFAELDWNPSTLAQAESRAHRIGQDKPVICRYLMASKTADDVIWNMLKTKQDTLNRAGLFCENLQDLTKTINQTTSYKIDSYYSPNRSRTSSTNLNDSNTSLNDSLNTSYEFKKNETIQSPIDKFLKPAKDALPAAPTKSTRSFENRIFESTNINFKLYSSLSNGNDKVENVKNNHGANHESNVSTTSSSKGVDSNSSNSVRIFNKPNNVTNSSKETDIFEEFLNDDNDDAIAALKSQIPSQHNKYTSNNHLESESIEKKIPRSSSNMYEDLFDDDVDADMASLKSQAPVHIKPTLNCASHSNENMNEFFGDDDDDAFKDLIF